MTASSHVLAACHWGGIALANWKRDLLWDLRSTEPEKETVTQGAEQLVHSRESTKNLKKVFGAPIALLGEPFGSAAMETINVAAIILTLAALGGLLLAGIRLSGKPRPPTWMALGHGAVAVTGTGLLAYLTFTTGAPFLVQIALGIFLLAAVGGAAIFLGFHLQEKPLPIPLVLGHGLLAATGLTLLLLSVFNVVV